ncbi:hypothetical protein [Chitinophaga sp. LS1]|uniref:hypothetical protein n=1 Tax=Chitinophaga sp. LS1 TaxID=3051176 RepID=UPI002AAC355D|nr:hypothetical protein [Chitinophaga sp. LS1]WPV66314.1 hypothetical protein QQL36_31440 [Chitinophaga sp. LS1]
MNLKTFNSENVTPIRESKPCVHFNTKTGLFNFSIGACTLIGLKDGDRVSFHQDEEEPTDWYLEVTKNGFELRAKENVTKGMLFNSSVMARALVYSVQEVKSGRVLIGSEHITINGKTLWPLITASLKQ